MDLRQVQPGGLDVVEGQVGRELRLVPLDGHPIEGDARHDLQRGEYVLKVARDVVPLPPEDQVLVEILLRVVVLEGGIDGC